VSEERGIDAEILAQHLGRHMLEPVADQEGIVFVEVAIVEDQEEFTAVGIEPLDRVRNARREVPEIADAHVINEIAAVRVDGGDAGGAVKHVGPLGGLVPMQLTHAAGIQAHVDAGDILGNAELARRHLPGPAAPFQPHMRVREGEAQVRQTAVVGRRRKEQVGVLPISHEVARARIGAAATGAHRLRDGLTGLRACNGRCREEAPGCCCRQHIPTRDGTHDFLRPDVSLPDVAFAEPRRCGLNCSALAIVGTFVHWAGKSFAAFAAIGTILPQLWRRSGGNTRVAIPASGSKTPQDQTSVSRGTK
jgi:hypothetical protein